MEKNEEPKRTAAVLFYNNIPYAFVSDARLPEDAPGVITFAGREYHSHLIGVFCPIASDELVELCETKL